MDSAPVDAKYPVVSNFEGVERVSEEFERSATIGKIAAALAKAQGQIEHASKDRTNTHFGSTYADLAAVIDACRLPLSENGIARHQATMSRGDLVGVRTMLVQADTGEFLANTIWVTMGKATPQQVGSVLTYLRRYSLSAAVGLAQDDDDAEAAQGRGTPTPTPPRASRAPSKGTEVTAVAPAPAADIPVPEGHVAVRTFKQGKWVVTSTAPKLTEGQQVRVKALQERAAIPDPEWRQKLTHYYGVDTSTALSTGQADDLIGRLESAVQIKGA